MSSILILPSDYILLPDLLIEKLENLGYKDLIFYNVILNIYNVNNDRIFQIGCGIKDIKVEFMQLSFRKFLKKSFFESIFVYKDLRNVVFCYK